MTDLDKARGWAEDGKGLYNPGSRTKAVIDIILSLPDQWVDVEKVRELLHWREVIERTPIRPAEAHLIERLRTLITPKLPTLAEMTEEERKACKWMQCMIGDDTDDYCLLITVDVPCSRVIFQNGNSTIWNNDLITPLPDLPKLEWPGSEPESTHFDNLPDEAKQVMKESIEEYKAGKFVDFDSSPRPEDVPPNEPWLIEANGQKAIGTRYEGNSVVPWSVASLDGSFAGGYRDSEVALIGKLVPEPPALPEGMRLADNEEFGRVVTSPWADDDNDYRIFFLNEDARGGANYDFAHESTLTFLDGEPDA